MVKHTSSDFFDGAAVDRILSPKEVRKRTSLSRSSLDRCSKTGDFPRPFPISARRVGWSEAEVVAWIKARMEAK